MNWHLNHREFGRKPWAVQVEALRRAISLLPSTASADGREAGSLLISALRPATHTPARSGSPALGPPEALLAGAEPGIKGGTPGAAPQCARLIIPTIDVDVDGSSGTTPRRRLSCTGPLVGSSCPDASWYRDTPRANMSARSRRL